MELSKIDLNEFYHTIMPKDKRDWNDKINILEEKAVENYRKYTKKDFLYIPKGVTRDILKRSILVTALYKVLDDEEFLKEVVSKLFRLSVFDGIISKLRSGL